MTLIPFPQRFYMPHAALQVTPEGGGEEWTPADLSGLALWLDASDLSKLFQDTGGTTPVSSDGDPVDRWNDKSGNAFDFTSSGGSARPTYHTSGGLHWVEGDGSNDRMTRAASIGLYAAGACSVFFSMRGDPTTGRTLFGDRGTGLYQFMSAGGDADDQSVIIRNDASVNILTLGAAFADEVLDGTDVVIGFTDSGSVMKTYAEGAEVDSDSYTRSGTMTATTTSLFANGTGSENFAARIYGMLVVLGRVVTSDERAKIVTYLASLQGRVL